MHKSKLRHPGNHITRTVKTCMTRNSKLMMQRLISTSLALVMSLVLVTSLKAATLDDVKSRGSVSCGVNEGLAGFSIADDKGNWTGMDVDFCRALAAAIFGDATKVNFVPLSATDRFDALQNSKIDVLSRNTTWTAERDTSMGLQFSVVTYYDGQAFMVRRSLGVISALQLGGAAICTQTGTTTELNVADYFRTNNMQYEVVAFETGEDLVAAYNKERCDAFTADASRLYAERLTLSNPEEHVVLPEIISKEPLGPVVRQGDDKWLNLVKWVHYAMVNAEELEVRSGNVDEMKVSTSPAVRRLLGAEGDFGVYLGVRNDWAYNIIKQVGNYGEVFERNIGASTPLGIARGVNALWSKGGIQYAPPIR